MEEVSLDEFLKSTTPEDFSSAGEQKPKERRRSSVIYKLFKKKRDDPLSPPEEQEEEEDKVSIVSLPTQTSRRKSTMQAREEWPLIKPINRDEEAEEIAQMPVRKRRLSAFQLLKAEDDKNQLPIEGNNEMQHKQIPVREEPEKSFTPFNEIFSKHVSEATSLHLARKSISAGRS